jgi:hypothetical protein
MLTEHKNRKKQVPNKEKDTYIHDVALISLILFKSDTHNQGDLYLTGHDTGQRQYAMEWSTSLATLLHQHLVKKFEVY